MSAPHPVNCTTHNPECKTRFYFGMLDVRDPNHQNIFDVPCRKPNFQARCQCCTSLNKFCRLNWFTHAVAAYVCQQPSTRSSPYCTIVSFLSSFPPRKQSETVQTKCEHIAKSSPNIQFPPSKQAKIKCQYALDQRWYSITQVRTNEWNPATVPVSQERPVARYTSLSNHQKNGESDKMKRDKLSRGV